MKFAFITTNLRGGGAEKVMAKFTSLLTERGHEAHLVLLEHIVDHEPPPGIHISALTQRGKKASKGMLGKRLLALRLKNKIRELAGERPFDLVMSTLPFADEVARLAQLPRLWHRIPNTLSEEIAALARADQAKARRREQKYRNLYAGGRLIAVSDGVAADLRSMGITAHHIERIYNPFDADAIRSHAADPSDRPQSPYLIHVGRFSPQKRHDLLLEAFGWLPPTHLLVLLCHDDPRLQEMIVRHQLQERVIVAGFQGNPYPWIAGADALILCSDHEGIGNVLVEALLLGTPVISTDCPSGPHEVLQGGKCGQLVPCGNVAALADAITATLAGGNSTNRFDPTPFLPESAATRLEQLASECN